MHSSHFQGLDGSEGKSRGHLRSAPPTWEKGGPVTAMLCTLGQSPALSGHVDGFCAHHNTVPAKGLDVGFSF